MTAEAHPGVQARRPLVDPTAGLRANGRRWMIHLPTTLTTLESTVSLVEQLRDYLGHVVPLDFGGVTLSEKDRLMVRHQVFCDQPLTGRLRCALRSEHAGPCAAGDAYRPVSEPPDH